MRSSNGHVQPKSFPERSSFNPILELMDKERSNWSSTLLRSRELSNHSSRGDCRVLWNLEDIVEPSIKKHGSVEARGSSVTGEVMGNSLSRCEIIESEFAVSVACRLGPFSLVWNDSRHQVYERVCASES